MQYELFCLTVVNTTLVSMATSPTNALFPQSSIYKFQTSFNSISNTTIRTLFLKAQNLLAANDHHKMGKVLTTQFRKYYT
jgi:hypothetical protein